MSVGRKMLLNISKHLKNQTETMYINQTFDWCDQNSLSCRRVAVLHRSAVNRRMIKNSQDIDAPGQMTKSECCYVGETTGRASTTSTPAMTPVSRSTSFCP